MNLRDLHRISRMCATRLFLFLRPYYKAVVYVMTRPSFAVRRDASIIVKRLLSALGGGKFAVSLLKEFSSFIHNPKTKVSTEMKSFLNSCSGKVVFVTS